MTGHPFDAIADGIDALPTMVPGVCMPAGPQVDQLASWLRWTPCRDVVVASAVPSSLAVVARVAAPGPHEGRCGEVSPMSRYSSKPVICALPATHAGWHRSDDGAEWSRDITPRVESANELANGGEYVAGVHDLKAALITSLGDSGVMLSDEVLDRVVDRTTRALGRRWDSLLRAVLPVADRAPATDGGAS